MVFKLLSLFNRDFERCVLNLSSMNIFVLFILGYVLYRFIGGFLIPLFRTSIHIRRQFNDANNRAKTQGENPPHANQGFTGTTNNTNATKPTSTKVGEYIDFEEIH
jgi:hypothetical protein